MIQLQLAGHLIIKAHLLTCVFHIFIYIINLFVFYLHLHFSHLADTVIQSDSQMRTIEAIKINKRATTCKCYDKSAMHNAVHVAIKKN